MLIFFIIEGYECKYVVFVCGSMYLQNNNQQQKQWRYNNYKKNNNNNIIDFKQGKKSKPTTEKKHKAKPSEANPIYIKSKTGMCVCVCLAC